MIYIFVGDGEQLPVHRMFDIDGGEVFEPKDAHSFIAMLPNGKWTAAQCFEGEIIPSKAQ